MPVELRLHLIASLVDAIYREGPSRVLGPGARVLSFGSMVVIKRTVPRVGKTVLTGRDHASRAFAC